MEELHGAVGQVRLQLFVLNRAESTWKEVPFNFWIARKA
jgi:hypothetical protein